MERPLFILTLWFGLSLPYPTSAQRKTPVTGTYDGRIGNDRIILVVESTGPDGARGYFVLNRGMATESSHLFVMQFSLRRITFQSDLYTGIWKLSEISAAAWEGKLTLFSKRKILFFFRPRVVFKLTLRPEIRVQPSSRYQNEIFGDVNIRKDMLYGKAKGYWTSSPFSDAPYIEVLGKGLIKTFRDQQPLDLKLDLYYPKGDTFTNRPLVMLIHGGAYYVGSKESATEWSLARSLARRGYVVASIDYRLGFKLQASEVEMGGYRAIQDAHAALRYLSHVSRDWGFNPYQVYVGGTSAGAIAALNVAFMDNADRPQGILKAEKDGQVGKIEESGNDLTDTFKIKAVANMWGAVNNLKIIGRDEKIPVLSIHGTDDRIVPYDYDHPFRNTLGFNRLIMDKMYGSKPIHAWLQALGIRNRLVPLEGQDHEPELESSNMLNQYMDTIITHVSGFFYEETAPSVTLVPGQQVVSESGVLKPVHYQIRNGTVVRIDVTGGVKVNPAPADATIIWFKNSEKKSLTFYTTNAFDAWNVESFPVTMVK